MQSVEFEWDATAVASALKPGRSSLSAISSACIPTKYHHHHHHHHQYSTVHPIGTAIDTPSRKLNRQYGTRGDVSVFVPPSTTEKSPSVSSLDSEPFTAPTDLISMKKGGVSIWGLRKVPGLQLDGTFRCVALEKCYKATCGNYAPIHSIAMSLAVGCFLWVDYWWPLWSLKTTNTSLAILLAVMQFAYAIAVHRTTRGQVVKCWVRWCTAIMLVCTLSTTTMCNTPFITALLWVVWMVFVATGAFYSTSKIMTAYQWVILMYLVYHKSRVFVLYHLFVVPACGMLALSYHLSPLVAAVTMWLIATVLGVQQSMLGVDNLSMIMVFVVVGVYAGVIQLQRRAVWWSAASSVYTTVHEKNNTLLRFAGFVYHEVRKPLGLLCLALDRSMHGDMKLGELHRISRGAICQMDSLLTDALSAGQLATIGTTKSSSERSAPVMPSSETTLRAASFSTVWIVDDVTPNRLLARRVLELVGHTVKEFSSGDAVVCAARLAPRVRPDVIFMDIVMDGLDGIQTLRILRTELGWLTPRIIAFTGSGVAATRDAFTKAGGSGSGFITRPTTRRDLLDAAKKV
jgi:CheY-like chemotaxis protein